ncbi:MAG: alpha-N-arabinofuranosidase, partial [Treponema sp.]|nr:alpha-N-arabinofuranosidase [Treponema sp.]
TLIKNADRVKIACLAQLVNVIAPIMTEKSGGAWRQTIFYPFMDASRYGRGTVLRCPVIVDKYDTKDFNDVPYLDAVAVYNSEKDEITIFAVNRNLKEVINLDTEISGFGDMTLAEHRALWNNDLDAVNSVNGEKVKPAIQQGGVIDNKSGSSRLTAELPAASWNVIRLTEKN